VTKISLELGSGGRLMREFIAGRIVPAFGDPLLGELGDAVHLPGGIAFTTDSYVVDPLFFPGGDIGRLAVNGTVNDLVVSGAKPRFLSLALILEEGLESDVLDRVIRSVRTAAKSADVRVVTGDTKVVRRGQGDKIFINTAAFPSPGRGRGRSAGETRSS
jgi:hydrogenase expression/formation protein HypE